MYQTILTNIGLAKLATAVANGDTLKLRTMALGDNNGIDNSNTPPSAEQSTLVREVYRAQVNTLAVDSKNPNWLKAQLIVPATVGGWTVREVGLYDDEGNLVAIGNRPPAYKPLLAEGSTSDLIVIVVIEVSNAGDFDLNIDPSVVLASREWVTENFSLSVLLPNGTVGQILRQKSNTRGDVEFYDPMSGMNILVDTIEENQNLLIGQSEINLAFATTSGAAVYIDGVRLRNNQWTAVNSTQIHLHAAALANGAVTIVQNEPAAAADFLHAGNDLSEIAARGVAAKKQALTNLGLPEDIDKIAAAVLQRQYPVGTPYLSFNDTDPALVLGFGSWSRIAQGRTLVGVNEADTDFNLSGKETGSKTVALTEAHPPKIRATIPRQTLQMDQVGDHTHPIAGAIVGGNGTPYYPGKDVAFADLNRRGAAPTENNATNAGGRHTPSGVLPQCQTNEFGGGQAHSIVQPSVAIYIWKRTA